MSAEELHFHRFPQLPTEIRLSVWRQCLPRRVCELDVPAPEIVFDLAYGAPRPCQLDKASRRNACPPAITRVCRESRGVAFETGRCRPFDTPPQESKWSSWNDWNAFPLWQDPHRELVHLHWSSAYDVDFEGDGDPLEYLRWHAHRTTTGMCSLTEDFLTDGLGPGARQRPTSQYSTLAAELASLERLPRTLVVIRIIVIHAKLKNVASTGLFGLLGDAPVQIIEAADEQRVEALFALAQSSQSAHDFATRQDLQRLTPDDAKQRLSVILRTKYGTKDLPSAAHPAYMFRLCTALCSEARREEPAKPPAAQVLHRGRGRGRGR